MTKLEKLREGLNQIAYHHNTKAYTSEEDIAGGEIAIDDDGMQYCGDVAELCRQYGLTPEEHIEFEADRIIIVICDPQWDGNGEVDEDREYPERWMHHDIFDDIAKEILNRYMDVRCHGRRKFLVNAGKYTFFPRSHKDYGVLDVKICTRKNVVHEETPNRRYVYEEVTRQCDLLDAFNELTKATFGYQHLTYDWETIFDRQNI